MSLPALAVAGALLASSRSVEKLVTVSALALLLPALGSASLAARVALLWIVPAKAGSVCTVMVKLWFAPTPSAPTLQQRVRAFLDLHSFPARRFSDLSTSVTVPPEEL